MELYCSYIETEQFDKLLVNTILLTKDFIKYGKTNENEYEIIQINKNESSYIEEYLLKTYDNNNWVKIVYRPLKENNLYKKVKKIFLIILGAKIITNICFLVNILLFYMLAKKVTNGQEPFKTHNIKYIRYSIYICLLAYYLILKLLEIVLSSHYVEMSLVDWKIILAGYILVFIEFLFKYAITIREDNDLIA